MCPASPTSITTTLPYASNSVWTASFSTQLSAELPYASYSGCSTVSGSSRGKWWVYPSGAPRGSTIYASTCTRNTDITTVIQLFEGTSTCVTGVSEPVCNSSAVALDTARGCSTLSFVPESGKVYYVRALQFVLLAVFRSKLLTFCALFRFMFPDIKEQLVISVSLWTTLLPPRASTTPSPSPSRP